MTEISVVIPVRNRPRLVRRALESALDQTLPADEVIVVDDASTDGTPAAVAEVGDPRVRLIRRDHSGGGSAARNTGIGAARGDLVALLDSDDRWNPARLAAAVRGRGPGLQVSGFAVHREGSRIEVVPACLRSHPRARLMRLAGGPLTASVFALDRELVDAGFRFDEEMPALQDLDFAIRVAHAGVPISGTSEILTEKEALPDGRIFNRASEVAARRMMLEKHRGRLAEDDVARALHRLAFARAMAMSDDVDHAGISRELRAARSDWRGPPVLAAALAWSLSGTRGLVAVCRLWWFVAQDPAATAKRRLGLA